MKHIRLVLALILPFLLSGCGLLPADSPTQKPAQVLETVVWPAVVECAGIPEAITEVQEVLLNGGGRPELEAIVKRKGQEAAGDVLCSADRIIQDMTAQGASLSEDSVAALERAKGFIEETGSKVERKDAP